MLTPTLLVFERRPRWVPELERQFQNQNVQVRGCRSLKDVLNRFATSPEAIVILDLEADCEGCLRGLARLMDRSPSPTIRENETRSRRTEQPCGPAADCRRRQTGCP